MTCTCTFTSMARRPTVLRVRCPWWKGKPLACLLLTALWLLLLVRARNADTDPSMTLVERLDALLQVLVGNMREAKVLTPPELRLARSRSTRSVSTAGTATPRVSQQRSLAIMSSHSIKAASAKTSGSSGGGAVSRTTSAGSLSSAASHSSRQQRTDDVHRSLAGMDDQVHKGGHVDEAVVSHSLAVPSNTASAAEVQRHTPRREE